MPAVPLMFHDWWEDQDRPVSRLMDQHFASGLRHDDLFGFSGLERPPVRSIFNNSYYRPWRRVTRQNSGGSSTLQVGKDKFQVGGIFNNSQIAVFSVILFSTRLFVVCKNPFFQ